MKLSRLRRSVSIGTKMLVSHITLALFVIVLASVLSYTLTFRYVRQLRINDLARKADRIAEMTQVQSSGDLIPPRRTLKLYQELTDARIFYLDAESESIRLGRYPADTAEAAMEQYQWVEVIDGIDRQFAGRILAGERVTALQRFEFAQGVILFAGAPVVDADGAILGGIILAQPIEQLRSLSRTIGLMLIGIVSLSLLLAMILALEETRMLVKPIRRITAAARHMSDGLYAERITHLPNDEIGEMGRALNSMAGRLIDVIKNLRKERDKLELIISSIGEGLVAVDRQWRVVHVNQSFLALLEIDAVERFIEAAEGELPTLKTALERCIQSGGKEELDGTNPSGRALHASITALTEEDGEILGAVCLLRDVSEAQRMEQIRRDYVANVSHELRTPLTGIRGMVEPLIDGCMDTEEERQSSYQVILRETIRLQKLVGEMLDMSRLQDGRLSVELERLELPGILNAAAQGMRSIADESGVALNVETDGTPLECMGNEDRITQVLVILLDNALSFTPEGGAVTVFGRDDGDRVAVGVRDTGCGIEPKDLPFIWERFYKVDKSRMRTTGTGLGLAIAKLVVELMGGEISVQSEPGKGSEFTFTLKK